jgi:hypothetical protein
MHMPHAPHLLDLQVGGGGAALDAVGGHRVGRTDEAEHGRLVAHLAAQVAQGLRTEREACGRAAEAAEAAEAAGCGLRAAAEAAAAAAAASWLAGGRLWRQAQAMAAGAPP